MLMKSINHKSFVLATVTALTALTLPMSQAYAEGPFARFAGHWRGTGKISTSNGTLESITCRGTFAAGEGGTVLSQHLACASASYKVVVESQVQAQGRELSGSWSETTRGVTGSVSGAIADGTIRATVSGGSFSAGLSLHVSGNSLSVVILPQGATDITRVTVALRRG